jgi:putative transposase
MQIVRSITAREMLSSHLDLKKELCGGEHWSDGYFVATIG